MKNKKGFTMVELIAVIVVLGLIILLAVPKVTSMIEKARKKNFVNEANTILKTAKMAYADKLDFNDTSGAKVYTVSDLKSSKYLDEADDITGCVGIYVDKDTGEATYVVKLAKNGKYYVSTDGTVKDNNIANDNEGLKAISDNESLCRIEAAYKKWWYLINDVDANDSLSIGDEVQFENEHFYVVGFDGDNVKLFAKYNLYVGNTCTSGSNYSCTPLKDPTGIQDKRAIGSGETRPYVATVQFSTTNYWQESNTLKSKYGTSYPAYVYDENSSIKTYLDNYENYLKEHGANVIKSRLISLQEIEQAGCVKTSVPYSGDKCSSGPSWLWSTTYWLGDATGNYGIQDMYNYNLIYDDNYSYQSYCGVRPLIIISRNDIKK